MKFLIPLALISFSFASLQDFTLAKRYEQDKVYRSAAEYYKRFLNDNPAKDKSLDAQWGLARSLRQLGEFEEALTFYDLIVNENPQFKDRETLLFESAELLEQMQRQSAADRYYQVAVLGKSAMNRKAHFKSVERSYANGDMEATKVRANTFVKKYSTAEESAQVMTWLGLIYSKEKSYDLAAEFLLKSLQLDDRAEAWLALGRVREQIEKGDPAEAYLRAARDSSQVGERARKALVHYYSSRQFFEALTEWYLKSNPTLQTEEQLKVIEALVEVKKGALALQEIKRLNIEDETYKNQRNILKGRALLSTGERIEGIRLLKEVGETGEVKAWRYIADIYFADEMYLNGIQALYRMIEFSPAEQRSETLLRIAKVYEKSLERWSTARGVYLQFERDYPSDDAMDQALYGIGNCLEAEGDLKTAARYYQRVFEDYPLSAHAKEAQVRHDYILRHEIKDLEGALNSLTDILTRERTPKQQVELAKIQLSAVKNYQTAYQILSDFVESNPQDTLVYEARYLMGKALFEQSNWLAYNKKNNKASQFKSRARERFSQLATDTLAGNWRIRAAWEVLNLDPFSLQSFKAFLGSYPQSGFEGEIMMRIGYSYLNEIRELKTPVAGQAQEAFQSVLNLPVSDSVKFRAFEGLTEAYLAGEKPEEALKILETLEQWKDRYPKSPRSLFNKGQVFASLQRYDEAIKTFNEVHYRFRNSYEAGKALLTAAVLLVKQDQVNDAIREYRLFINGYPGHEEIPTAYLALARLKEKEGALKNAYELLNSFLVEIPDHPKAYLIHEEMARLGTLLDDRLRAAGHYEMALKTAPDGLKDELSLKAAEVYLALEKYKQSLSLFTLAESLLVKPRAKAIALSGRLASLSMLGDHKGYDKDFKSFRKLYEDEDEAYARIVYYEGRRKMEDGDNDRAIKRFEYLVDRFAETSWAGEGSYYTGLISFKKGRYTEAITLLEKYLQNSKLGKNVTEARFKLAGAYFQLGQFNKSAEIYETISEGEQGSDLLKYRSRYNAAITFEKTEDWYRAALMYSKIFDRDQAFLTNNNLKVSAGFAWFNAGEYGKALNYFKEVVDAKGSERAAEAHFWYAKTLDHVNRVEEAIEEYLKVSYLYRGEGMWGLTALFEVGQIYERSADYDRAERMYQQIVDQDGTQGTLGSRALVYLEKMRERRK